MMPRRLSTKRADFMAPRPYNIWFKYLGHTKHSNRIGVSELMALLEKNALIEIFYWKFKQKENLRCNLLKPLTTKEIIDLITTLRKKFWQF